MKSNLTIILNDIKLKMFVFFFTFFFFACQNDVTERKEYYLNGEVKRVIFYKTSFKDREEKYFYPNGILMEHYYYLNNKLEGDYISYDSIGKMSSKGYFKDGRAVGPTYYYHNGRLILFNEKDFSGEIYYVKKYDSSSNELLKEEGVCLSPNVIHQRNHIFTEKKDLLFMYAQPDGYLNSLSVLIGNIRIKFDTLKGHIGIITYDPLKDIGKEVKIYSLLKSRSLGDVCKDSLKVVLE